MVIVITATMVVPAKVTAMVNHRMPESKAGKKARG